MVSLRKELREIDKRGYDHEQCQTTKLNKNLIGKRMVAEFLVMLDFIQIRQDIFFNIFLTPHRLIIHFL